MGDTPRNRRLNESVNNSSGSLSGSMDMSSLMDELERMRRKLDEQDRLIQLLRHDAMTDPLTGLYNRRAFEAELERSVSNAHRYDRPSALLLIDLDSFKAVNDKMGHQVGDQVLAHVASILKQNTRTNDVVARVGGDEFCIILNEIRSIDNAYQKAADLADIMARTPCMLDDGHRVQVSASIGTRAFGADDHYDDIIADADARMYADKKADNN